jgi:AraC-like DNA-binding protein
VLVSRRDTRCADLGARVSTTALLHSRFRVHLVENEAVICDDALALRAFDRKGELGRPVATIVLEGRARLRSGGLERWLAPGSVARLPSKSGVEMRQEAEPRYVALVLEWEPGTLFAGRPAAFEVETCAGEADALSALAARVREGDVSVAEPLARMVGGARSDQAPDREDEDAARFGPLSAALDRALSLLDAQPMTVDLERTLGLSARQVTRVVTDFNARYGFNAGTWRDARNRRRLLVGAALLSQPDAALDEVARAVGYQSTTALCRAFANASLPSPASIAGLVASG